MHPQASSALDLRGKLARLAGGEEGAAGGPGTARGEEKGEGAAQKIMVGEGR